MYKIAPRAKCDQVVYEAIAKITEIITRSRCDESDLHTPDSVDAHAASDRSRANSAGGYNSSSNSSSTLSSSSSARFNIEIQEVESIR